MKATSITFEELMKECNFTDSKEFIRVLQKNGIQIRRGTSIAADIASKIVKRLQGRSIDWYRYGQRVRDNSESGPLKFSESDAYLKLATDWYQRIAIGEMHTSLREETRLLGCACKGGFLESDNEESFVLRVEPGINVFIGDRGSGKSTALNLLAVLAATSISTTGALLDKLLILLHGDDISQRSRRIRDLLRHYGIKQYGCFYRLAGITCAQIIDLEENIIAHFRQENGNFLNVNGEQLQLPAMQVLQQGEVFRIADDSQQFYLNNIVDALFPKLGDLRQALVRKARAVGVLALQLKDARRGGFPGSNEFDRFYEHRTSDLNLVRRLLSVGEITPAVEEFLRRCIRETKGTPKSQALASCLSGDENDFWQIWLGGIRPSIRNRIEYVLDNIRQSPVSEFAKDDISLETLDDISTNQADPWDVLRSCRNLLLKRLRELRTIRRQYESRRLLTADLFALSKAYLDFLDLRILVVQEQMACSQRIADVLNGEGGRSTHTYRVSTKRAAHSIEDSQRKAESLKTISETDIWLSQADYNQPLERVTELLNNYQNTIEWLIEDSLKIAKREEQTGRNEVAQLDIYFDPIEIELLQGATFRPFENLSFGQRSGIILKMVLGSTSSDIVIMDQPEDNLDAYAIGSLLAPTLETLGRNRQIIIATHNSNLVLGLRDSNLLVMESRGSYGVLKIRGRGEDNAVTQALLNVLEGGTDSFRRKITAYADIVQRLSGFIRDMEIGQIESIFRRRIIDGLRNFLQPVVSSSSMLSVFRHELSQPTTIGSQVSDARNTILKSSKDVTTGRAALLRSIDEVLVTIESHVDEFQRRIQHLRMMDTEPHPELVNIGDLLELLTDEFSARILHPREVQISVDFSLRGLMVYADRNHLRLIFENLLNNALRATELRSIELFSFDSENPVFVECISIELNRSDPDVAIRLIDNGRGMIPEIRSKLYRERCSDQHGSDHGLGGIIIRKMLELNAGSIDVLQSGINQGTTQEILLKRALETK